MQRHRIIMVISLVAAVGILAGAAFAQGYEVRTFTVPDATVPPVPVDATNLTTDETFQYLYNSVRKQWVCPFCSYSRDAQLSAGSADCPNPWGITDHPTVALQSLASMPRSRLLTLAAQAMAEEKSDLQEPQVNPSPPALGELLYRAVIGRPYKPSDSDGNEVRSRLFAAVAGLLNNNPANGPVVSQDDPVRFLVIPPTPLRREPIASDAPGTEYGLPERRPMARRDPGSNNYDGDPLTDEPDFGGGYEVGDNSARPQVIGQSPAATIIKDDGTEDALADPPEAAIGSLLTIGVNPYRVDEGDVWWVRYEESATLDVDGNAKVTAIRVYFYSVLNGWQGDVDAGGDAVPVEIENGGNKIEFPISVIDDSGSIKVTFEGEWSNADSSPPAYHTWVVRFMVRSNCRLIPGWWDMLDKPASYDTRTEWETYSYDPTDWNGSADPYFRTVDGEEVGNNTLNLVSGEWPTERKRCWFEAKSGVPTVTTEDDMAGTTTKAEGYTIPANLTGDGTIAVQWREPEPGGEPPWTNTGSTYYRTGKEWQYDATIRSGAVTSITNAEAAAATPTTNLTAEPYVQYAGARFMVTRPEVQRTGSIWDKLGDGSIVENAETSGLDPAYPKVVLGLINGLYVHGVFGPGSVTPRHAPSVLNRWDGTELTQACDMCGYVRQGVGRGTVPAGEDRPCPYHEPPTQDPSDDPGVRVSGAGNVPYNGDYAYEGQHNDQPYYRYGSQYLYYSDVSSEWLLSGLMNDVRNDAKYYSRRKLGMYKGIVKKKKNNPDWPPPRVSVAITGELPNSMYDMAPQGGGAYQAAEDVWRQATAINVDERLPGATVTRHAMAASAFKGAGQAVASHNNNGTAAAEPVWAAIPQYQPPSVPAPEASGYRGLANDLENDFGYRGGLVLHRNEPPASIYSGLLDDSLTSGWDSFYRNPDTGHFQTQTGQWPFICAGADNTTPSADDHIVWDDTDGNNDGLVDASVTCAEHPAAGTAPAGRQHFYCPTCGAEFSEDVGACPFEGRDLEHVNWLRIVRPEHLAAEEFDPFDVQVSVGRSGGLAQSSPTISIGRVAPGVGARNPDTTTGPITDHRAFPGDVSPLPQRPHRPSDARAQIRNEGNVALSLRVGNVYDFDPAAILDRGGPPYLRADVDPLLQSYARQALSGPMTRETFMPRIENPAAGAGALFEGALLNQSLWDVMAPGTEQIAGENTWLSGGGIRTGSAGLINAGTTGKPVPLGQPAGTYLGKHLQYVDVNGDGAFNFAKWNVGTGTYVNTDSSVSEYNASIDLPLEPLAGLLQGQMRVFEGRLPQSDPYSADNDPIVVPGAEAGEWQVLWASNRRSADPGQAGYDSNAAPAGTGPAAYPSSASPLNLLYVTTDFAGDADDPLYRRYVWQSAGGALTPPRPLTDDPAGAANSAPWAMRNPADGSVWAFWHRSLRHAGGTERTLRYNRLTSGSVWDPATEAFIYDTGLPKQGLRGFIRPGGAWLFWHAGTAGRERLMYRWRFDGTTSSNEAPLPVTNAAPTGGTDLISARRYGADGTTLEAVTIRRPPTSPFTYTRDVSVYTVDTPTASTLDVYFSGFVTHEGQADICRARFDLNAIGPAQPTNNYGKLPYARVNNEEMDPDGLHQLWGSRHLDWLVGQGANLSGTSLVPAFNPADGLSPSFRLQLGYRDTIGDGQPRPSQSFNLVWENSRDNTYDRARGLYRVTPILIPLPNPIPPHDLATLPSSCAIDRGGGTSYYIRDPHSPANNPRPLTMEIDPAAGTVQFSSPLFNEDAPNDPSAAFNAVDMLGTVPLNDVVLMASYSPYIFRVTRSGANDSMPSAFYDENGPYRVAVIWRRSFPASETPHFGRPAYMYRAYTNTIQVGRPPISGNVTVTPWNIDMPDGSGGAPLAEGPDYTVDANTGTIEVNPQRIGQFLRVAYSDGTTTRVERHEVIGWSREMVVPVDTVVGEGSMVAVPESYRVPVAEGSATLIPAVRYWIFWSSPRGVYDLRLVENSASRVAGDVSVHPSSDIYSAVVTPEFGQLAPERVAPTVSPDRT